MYWHMVQICWQLIQEVLYCTFMRANNSEENSTLHMIVHDGAAKC